MLAPSVDIYHLVSVVLASFGLLSLSKGPMSHSCCSATQIIRFPLP